MRLWHYRLIPILPDKMLISQWRECIAIKRQWEKGTLKHPLVSYVMNYHKGYFNNYVSKIVCELDKRKIKFKWLYIDEICNFCNNTYISNNYPEHNNRYLKQCLFNLQEKYDRGIINFNEWNKIEQDFIYK